MKQKHPTLRQILLVSVAVAVFFAGFLAGAQGVEKPDTVIHVVTVDWVDGASDEDIQKALDGVEQLARDYDGIERVWLRSIKSQTKDAAFVMEFTSEQALADYAGSEAQQKWYEVYRPVRDRSVTSDITN